MTESDDRSEHKVQKSVFSNSFLHYGAQRFNEGNGHRYDAMWQKRLPSSQGNEIVSVISVVMVAPLDRRRNCLQEKGIRKTEEDWQPNRSCFGHPSKKKPISGSPSLIRKLVECNRSSLQRKDSVSKTSRGRFEVLSSSCENSSE